MHVHWDSEGARARTRVTQGKEASRRRTSGVPEPRLSHVHPDVPPLPPSAPCTPTIPTCTLPALSTARKTFPAPRWVAAGVRLKL